MLFTPSGMASSRIPAFQNIPPGMESIPWGSSMYSRDVQPSKAEIMPPGAVLGKVTSFRSSQLAKA